MDDNKWRVNSYIDHTPRYIMKQTITQRLDNMPARKVDAAISKWNKLNGVEQAQVMEWLNIKSNGRVSKVYFSSNCLTNKDRLNLVYYYDGAYM